jgi:Tfp pilus assembly protein PilX
MNPMLHGRRWHREQGVSLMVVLVALVIISFAALALLRSSDTSTIIAGNLAFQKTALQAGDAGVEEAIAFLVPVATGTALFNDDAANGYFATTTDACDVTGQRTPDNPADDVNWDGTDPGAGCNLDAITPNPQPAGVADGFTVRYVINRVCNAEGDPNSLLAADGATPMTCSRLGAGASEGSTRGGPSYGNLPLTGESQQYYRITTRVEGPRNTVRYVQALVVI